MQFRLPPYCRLIVFLSLWQGAGIAYAAPETRNNNDIYAAVKKFIVAAKPKMEKIYVTVPQMKSEDGNKSNNADSPFAGIPDGEELILQIGADKYMLNEGALAIKHGDDVYFSFSDFISSLDFPIKFNLDDKTASGWFIREDKKFDMNLENKTVKANGKDFTVPDNAVIEQDGEIFIKSSELGKWFDMSFETTVHQMKTDIASKDPLPIVEQGIRKKRAENIEKFDYDAIYPRVKNSPKNFSAPYIDVMLNGAYSKNPETGSYSSGSYSLLGANDIAGMQATQYLGGSDKTSVEEFRFTLLKEDENGETIGPFGLKSAEFGDVNAVSLPLAGGGGQESGIRLSSVKQEVQLALDKRRFSGDIQPGWDVEIYRNELLLAFQTAGPDGRYDFGEIDLYAGDNNFRLVFYGPQGERKQEELAVPIMGTHLGIGDGAYQASLTRNGEVTYRNYGYEDSSGPNGLKFSGKYDFGLTDWLTMGTGVLAGEKNGKDQIVNIGTASLSYGKSILDINAANESEGGSAIEAISRHQIGNTSWRGRFMTNTKDYNTSSENGDKVIMTSSLDIAGKLIGRTNFKVNSKLEEYDSDNKRWLTGGGLSTHLFGWNIQDNIQRVSDDFEEDNEEGKVSYQGDTTISGQIFRSMFLRARANYDIKPEYQMNSYLVSLSKSFSDRFSVQNEVEHYVETGETEDRLRFNIRTDHFWLSPSLSYDSEDNFSAYMSLHFGLGRDPNSGQFTVTKSDMTSSGGVAALTYHDLNANGYYDEGEPKLKDIGINQRNNMYKRAKSDKNGIAYIPDLGSGLITDIELDTATLPDPVWMPTKPGFSVNPRPGSVTYMEFPLVMSGEIDGTVEIIGKLAELRKARTTPVNLYSLDGKLIQSQKTAYDGYYSMIQIPPGDYLLSVDAKAAEDQGMILPPMRKIHIGPDGTVLNDVRMTMVSKKLPPEMKAQAFARVAGRTNTVSPWTDGGDTTYVAVNIGNYGSPITMAVTWLQLNRKYPELFKSIMPVRPIRAAKIGLNGRYHLTVGPVASFDTANSICAKIRDTVKQDCFPVTKKM